MKLEKPIVIFDPMGMAQTIDHLDLVITDDNVNKMVLCKILSCPVPLLLWNSSEYDIIGDYTQAQVEQKILDILGNNPSIVIQGLLYSRSQR